MPPLIEEPSVSNQESDIGLRLVRSEGRDPEIVHFERAVVSNFVSTAELLGMPKSVAAIYGCYFASAEPLGFPDVMRRLDLSMGSVSQGMRFLCGIGALKPAAEAKDRTARYEPDIELRKLLLHYLEKRVEKHLAVADRNVEAIQASVPAASPEVAKLLATRVESLAGWSTKSAALLPLLKGALRLA